MKFSLPIFLFIFSVFSAYGQVPEKKITGQDQLLGENLADLDTIPAADTTVAAVDSVTRMPPPKKKGAIETTIKYSAKDSMIFSMSQKKVFLYGESKIDYGEIKLEAAQVEIDWKDNLISANGVVDSTGKKSGMPVFHNGNEVYATKGMKYNFKTKRAVIKDVVTEMEGGYIRGEEVFKNEDNELFSKNNTYTTCNLEHPHYRIKSKKTKAIPNDKIVSGPFNLEINDVPTPLGFAFGMFPAKNEAASGIIVPSYGEEQRRGFYLRGGGYFIDVSDYMKVKITGDVYTKGGHGLNVAIPYKKRYKHNGNFNFSYTKLRLSDEIENDDTQNDYSLRWSHTPETKGTSRFSATVNAATSTYNTNNNLGVIQNTTRKLNSSVTYSKTFRGTPFSLGLSARHTQDVSTNEVDLLLPDLTFNVENIYPFRKKNGPSKTWYQKMAIRWSLKGTNRINNNLGPIGEDIAEDSISAFNFNTLPELLKNSKKGLEHSIPLSTSLNIFKYFTLSPSFNYTEKVYFEKLNWGLNEDGTGTEVLDTIPGFNRVGSYSTSASITTRIFGTYFFKKGNIKAIRHVMNPSLSFSYRPDFSDTSNFDYYQRIELENGTSVLKSRHEGFVYGSAPTGESGSIGFNLNNTLEMKVKSKNDSIDQDRKVPLLNSFGFSTSYNIVADSFNLADISWRANTSVFNNKLSINLTGSIDPYIYVLNSPITVDESGNQTVDQRQVNEFAWNNGRGIGQLQRASIALSTNLNPKARDNEKDTQDKIRDSDLSQADKDYLLNNPETYVDFNIPWSLRINYNLGYSKIGFQESNITQSLNFSGDFSLSEKWKVTYNSGYDFENKAFTQTNLGISRDLHCWEMNFTWTPFGRFTSYDFTIRVKSSLLQDLKINRRRSFTDSF